MRVLVVDDDARLVRALRRGLEAEGFAVDTAADGVEGEWLATENPYDVMVLDVMLPVVDGLELCARLRRAQNWTPILVLTAKSDSADVVRALDTGADDFLAKPFAYGVLLARVRALVRRVVPERPTVLTAGDLTLDPARHTVHRRGTPIELTPKQFAVLEYLMRRAGEVVPKAELLEHLWDFDFEGDPNIVEVYVAQLRRRIDQPFGTTTLRTVRLVGYQLTAEG
jgi:two-component system, OmpR family, response regulator